MPNTTSREGFVHSGGFQAGDACETTFIYGLSRLAIRFPCIRHSSDNRGRVVTLTEGIRGFWGGLEAFIRRYPGPESCGSIAIRTQSKQRALWLISRQYSVHDSRSKTPFFARELCIWRYIYCFPLPLLDGNFTSSLQAQNAVLYRKLSYFLPLVGTHPFPVSISIRCRTEPGRLRTPTKCPVARHPAFTVLLTSFPFVSHPGRRRPRHETRRDETKGYCNESWVRNFRRCPRLIL